MIGLRHAVPAVFRRGEWDGFLALTTDNLAKIVVLPAILMGAFRLGPEVVYGKILAGLGLTLLIGQGGLIYLAHRLGRKEGRGDITALPYGISTPAMFVYLFAVIGPIYGATNNPLMAYQVGLAAAFIGGLVEVAGAAIGPLIERYTPRAGILGTVAGVALVWIALVPSSIIFANPLIGLPCLFILLLGLAGNHKFPLGLPAGLIVIGLGIGLGLITGDAAIRMETLTWHVPVPVVGDLVAGIGLLFSHPEILTAVVAVEVYNFMEAIANIESARTVGDNYHLQTTMIWSACGTCIGALLGSPFPTAIYLGQPAYKKMGARQGYAAMTAGFLFLASLIGGFAFLQHLIPAASITVLLVFIGLAMTQYAFQASPAAHGIAIGVALIPHIADLLHKQLDGTLTEVLPSTAVTSQLSAALANNQGVYLQSYALLSHGAIITGLLWGSLTVFLIDGRLRAATVTAGLACLLSLAGLIHADHIGLALSPITEGYLVLTVFLGVLAVAERVRAAALRPDQLGHIQGSDLPALEESQA
jgi:adenine/guanine/hypoxanthine permease